MSGFWLHHIKNLFLHSIFLSKKQQILDVRKCYSGLLLPLNCTTHIEDNCVAPLHQSNTNEILNVVLNKTLIIWSSLHLHFPGYFLLSCLWTAIIMSGVLLILFYFNLTCKNFHPYTATSLLNFQFCQYFIVFINILTLNTET